MTSRSAPAALPQHRKTAPAVADQKGPARPVRARPEALGRLRHRVARTFLLGAQEPILDILDQGLVTRGVFEGKHAWVLTDKRLYGLTTGRRHQRVVLERHKVSGVSVAQRPRPVGMLASLASLGIALLALGASEAAVYFAPSLLVYPILVMVFGAATGAALWHAVGRHAVVEVVADGQTVGIPVRGVTDDDVMEFASRVMGNALPKLPAPVASALPAPQVAQAKIPATVR